MSHCILLRVLTVHVMGVGTGGIMGMCKGFCNDYYNACKDDMALADDFCAQHASDSYWCKCL